MVGDRMEAELVRDTVLRLTEFGTAADSFVLASAAPLATYAVRLDAMTYDGWRARGRADFRVAEYRAPQFRASVTLDSGLRYLGDSVRAHVNASYYFGAPMAGAVVRWHVSSRESGGYVHIPGLPREYIVARRFDSGVHRYTAGGDTSGVDTLDANGRLTFSAPTLRGTLIGPAEVSVQVAVEDLDRQTV